MSEQDSNKGEYEHDLDISLQSQIDVYEQSRKDYWEEMLGKDTDKLIYEQAERFAKAIINNTEQLISTKKLDEDLHAFSYELNKIDKFPWEDYRRKVDNIVNSNMSIEKKTSHLVDLEFQSPGDDEFDIRAEDSPLKLIWERIHINLARDAVNKKIGKGAERTLKLYKLVIKSSPSQATRTFLSRLSRCYIWGFDTECVILCRSAMEMAFNDKISFDMCEKCLVSRHRDYTLNDRIAVAKLKGLLDEDTSKTARNIKDRGNTALHKDPNVTKDIFGTIEDTANIIDVLTRA